MSDPDLISFDATLQGLQALSVARANNAFALLKGEESAVRRALNILLLVVQKLIGLPLQPNSSVWAGVYKGADTIALSYDKDCQLSQAKTAGARVLKFAQLAQGVVHGSTSNRLIALGSSLTRGVSLV